MKFDKIGKYIIPLAVLTLIVYGVSYRLINKNRIRKCYKLTSGEIIRIQRSSNNRGTYVKYFVEGKRYNALGKLYSKTLNVKYVTIIYPCTNPGFGQVLLTPEEFKEYNLPYPDSLKWVSEYFENDSP